MPCVFTNFTILASPAHRAPLAGIAASMPRLSFARILRHGHRLGGRRLAPPAAGAAMATASALPKKEELAGSSRQPPETRN